jgi:endonuclease/exonuclease/phosphatase family metal-dependent hydrolase
MADYIIGAFNTHFFSGVGKHDLQIIGNIISNEGFDIVALQEITRREALNSLLGRLPKYWTGVQETPLTSTAEVDDTVLEEGENPSKEKTMLHLGMLSCGIPIVFVNVRKTEALKYLTK